MVWCAPIARSRSDETSKFTWNGWSIGRDNTRFLPGDVARLSVDDVKRLKVKWAFGFEGDISAFAQPTIAGNQITALAGPTISP